MLRGAASTIRSVYGSYGKCYRTGGDEFVVILEEPVEKLSVLNESFEKAAEKWHGKQVAELNISYGVALSEEVCSIDEQIILADQRMYFAKKAYYQRIGKRQKKLLVQRIKDYKRQKLLLYMKYEISLNLCKVSKWGLNQADKGVIITTQKSLFKLN